MSMHPASWPGLASIGSGSVAGSTPVGGTVLVRRASDSANKNNNTLASDDTLKWAVAASEVWAFEAFLIFNGANTTMDFLIGWSVPASTTMQWGQIGNPASNGLGGYSVATTANTPVALIAAGGTLAGATGAAIAVGIEIAGIIVVSSTAGNMNLQWAQNTTDAGNLFLAANSFLRATRLA